MKEPRQGLNDPVLVLYWRHHHVTPTFVSWPGQVLLKAQPVHVDLASSFHVGNGRPGWMMTMSYGDPDYKRPFGGLKRGGSSSVKLVSGAIFFCLFTLSVFSYQFSRISQGEAALPSF
jgi:hypothetical protein